MKNKWYLSRSFVRKKIVRASVCASFLLSRFAPPSFITAPPSCARFFSLVEEFVVHHCVHHRRLFNTEQATPTPLVVALRDDETHPKNNLRISNMCAPRWTHDEREREARMGGKITFCSFTLVSHGPLTAKKKSALTNSLWFLNNRNLD